MMIFFLWAYLIVKVMEFFFSITDGKKRIHLISLFGFQLDGYMARRMKINSVVGSYLDPLADKVSFNSFYSW